jgi:hypothetical protein
MATHPGLARFRTGRRGLTWPPTARRAGGLLLWGHQSPRSDWSDPSDESDPSDGGGGEIHRITAAAAARARLKAELRTSRSAYSRRRLQQNGDWVRNSASNQMISPEDVSGISFPVPVLALSFRPTGLPFHDRATALDVLRATIFIFSG